MGMSLKEDTDGLITECRESSRKLISPKNREKILSFRKRKFQSEGNQFLSRLTFPWTRSSSTGRIRRPAAGDSSTRGLSSTTAPCTTSDLNRTVCLNIQHLLCYPRCVINSETKKRVS